MAHFGLTYSIHVLPHPLPNTINKENVSVRFSRQYSTSISKTGFQSCDIPRGGSRNSLSVCVGGAIPNPGPH